MQHGDSWQKCAMNNSGRGTSELDGEIRALYQGMEEVKDAEAFQKLYKEFGEVQVRLTDMCSGKGITQYDLEKFQNKLGQLDARLYVLGRSLKSNSGFRFKSLDKLDHEEGDSDNIPVILDRKESIPAFPIPSSRGENEISHRVMEQIVLKDLHENSNVYIHDLNGCEIHCSSQTFGSLRCTDLDSCSIFLDSPDTMVQGACMFTRLYQCNVNLSARQLRIHDSKDCVFTIHTQSSPTIEGCGDIVFKQKKGVDGVNRWDQVQDFDWPRMDIPSPNWKILRD